MIVIKAPYKYIPEGRITLFLAGSIEMGTAEKWQDKFIRELDKFEEMSDVVVFNPRRDDWDSSWEQRIDNPNFREQVEWELRRIERADIVAMHFVPDTKSPITLLELGLVASMKPSRTVVYCPEGFWRKGNVDIVCRKYDIVTCSSWHDFVLETYYKLLLIMETMKWTGA